MHAKRNRPAQNGYSKTYHRMRRVPIDSLQSNVVLALNRAGLDFAQARTVADVLVYSDACGIFSHGTMRLPHYLARMKSGGINLSSEFPVRAGKYAWCAVVDARGGFGHVASDNASKHALSLARAHGISVVSVINSSHCGVLSYYMREAAEAGFIVVAAANADSCVVPYGGRDAYFGTNPMAWAFPCAQEGYVIFDMATSAGSLGKIMAERTEGRSIPKDWAVDERGQPTTDPHAVKALLPAGGHKGYGLAFAAEALSALLTASPFGPHIAPMYKQLDVMRDAGAFFLVMDAELFAPNILSAQTSVGATKKFSETFSGRMRAMAEELRAQRPAEGFASVEIPGDSQRRSYARSLEQGVPILDDIYQFLYES